MHVYTYACNMHGFAIETFSSQVAYTYIASGWHCGAFGKFALPVEYVYSH